MILSETLGNANHDLPYTKNIGGIAVSSFSNSPKKESAKDYNTGIRGKCTIPSHVEPNRWTEILYPAASYRALEEHDIQKNKISNQRETSWRDDWKSKQLVNCILSR